MPLGHVERIRENVNHAVPGDGPEEGVRAIGSLWRSAERALLIWKALSMFTKFALLNTDGPLTLSQICCHWGALAASSMLLLPCVRRSLTPAPTHSWFTFTMKLEMCLKRTSATVISENSRMLESLCKQHRHRLAQTNPTLLRRSHQHRRRLAHQNRRLRGRVRPTQSLRAPIRLETNA